jgi:hypothetical protein
MPPDPRMRRRASRGRRSTPPARASTREYKVRDAAPDQGPAVRSSEYSVSGVATGGWGVRPATQFGLEGGAVDGRGPAGVG